mmetsp:Transcript_39608/g.99826  ORF Transcript_39608/g.99826 Transcript_39608/m.99826 type:complete len:113 (-) Transcript_39608:81-419(-)|eukprot:CAMPEP_0177667326 /NCGR_PEP_ID=MMETSP0447-20121125/22062_1 /TAXON_ID=0 /ORGANISM="Stygamoeba regulata, Strain BSH-02190019" /LENGTH=112 /DNA_ID=CAMNT_0019173547 /DNA_START=36 /DNA_END=374 /DNA_ORIENTATION=+
MNLQGQLLADRLALAIVSFFSLWGFAVGYYLETFQYTLIVFLCGMLAAAMAVLPDWPVFNQARNALVWKDPESNETRALLNATSAAAASSATTSSSLSPASGPGKKKGKRQR